MTSGIGGPWQINRLCAGSFGWHRRGDLASLGVARTAPGELWRGSSMSGGAKSKGFVCASQLATCSISSRQAFAMSAKFPFGRARDEVRWVAPWSELCVAERLVLRSVGQSSSSREHDHEPECASDDSVSLPCSGPREHAPQPLIGDAKNSAKTAYARSRLSRLECDYAAAPGGQRGDGERLGSAWKSLIGACRRPAGAPVCRGREDRHRSGGRGGGAECHLYLGWNRGQRARPVAR